MVPETDPAEESGNLPKLPNRDYQKLARQSDLRRSRETWGSLIGAVIGAAIAVTIFEYGVGGPGSWTFGGAVVGAVLGALEGIQIARL